MKVKSQVMEADGFDRSVAEKMPKMRKLEDPLLKKQEEALFPAEDAQYEGIEEVRPSEKPEKTIEKKPLIESSKPARETREDLDVHRLVEDLHTQLLVSTRVKKALEMDLASQQKTIQQLLQDNKELRNQLEVEKQELQRVREAHAESIYLKEENEEALLKIQELQQELKVMKERLAKALKEKDEAFHRVRELESQRDQNEVAWVKEKMREREASHFYEENMELRSRLEEALAKNAEMENKYDLLKRSFHEVKESLTMLRDTCKKNYYHLSDTSEGS